MAIGWHCLATELAKPAGATAGKNDGNYQAVTVGVRVPLKRSRDAQHGAALRGPFF
jgi:hypothetical protein